jgi:hypothetical protein
MNREEIEKGIGQALDQWRALSVLRRQPRELTGRAFSLLVSIVDNIQHDPSPLWRDYEYDGIQRYVVSAMPSILIDIDNRLGYRQRNMTQISSWEILHGISFALERWCPIPKDI